MDETSELTKVTRNGQITLPANLRRAVNIEVGDYIEVTVQDDGLLLTPKKLIDKSQAYFWTEEWQKGERQADEDKKAGRIESFESVEDLITDLHKRAGR